MAESSDYRPPTEEDSKLPVLKIDFPSTETMEHYLEAHKEIVKLLKEEVIRLQESFTQLREILIDMKFKLMTLED